jgi:hypothetical protein
MKKLIILVLLVAVGYGAWCLYTKTVKTPIPTPTTSTSSTTFEIHPDLSNGTFEFEGENITLKNGANQTEVGNGGAVQETTLTDLVAYGDLNQDTKEDEVAIMVQNGAGSGIFFYVVGYVSGPVAHKGTNAVFVGDRISPQKISINKEGIMVTYLDRKPDEAFDAEPTVEHIQTFVYKNGVLREK